MNPGKDRQIDLKIVLEFDLENDLKIVVEIVLRIDLDISEFLCLG